MPSPNFLREAHNRLREAFGGKDTLADLLRVHLVMEQILTESLQLVLLTPGALLPHVKLRFFQKARLLRSMNFLTDDALDFLLELNSLRNRFAHSVRYELTEKDVEGFGRLCPDLYKTIEADELNTRFSKLLSRLMGQIVGQLEGGARVIEEGG